MFNHLQLNHLNSRQQKEAELFKYTLHCISCARVIYDLTPVSPIYSEDPPVQQKEASHQNLLVYSQIDSVVSGVRGLISELKPKQNNFHL